MCLEDPELQTPERLIADGCATLSNAHVNKITCERLLGENNSEEAKERLVNRAATLIGVTKQTVSNSASTPIKALDELAIRIRPVSKDESVFEATGGQSTQSQKRMDLIGIIAFETIRLKRERDG